MTATVVLARHGSTQYNRGGVGKDKIRGWADIELDAMGRLEGKELAKECKDHEHNVVAILTSDLGRAVETAKLIGKGCQAPIYTTPALRSWNLGDLQGRVANSKVIHDIVQAVKTDKAVPEGEKFSQYVNRFLGFFEGVLGTIDGQTRPKFNELRVLLKTQSNPTVVLVTHARGIQLAQVYLDHGSSIKTVLDDHADELAEEPDTVKPGGYLRIQNQKGEWRIVAGFRQSDARAHAALS